MTEEQENTQFKRVLRTYKLQAVENGKIPNATIVLDKNAAYVTGLQLNSPNKSKLNFRGRIGVRLDKDELVPPDTNANIFVSSVSVPPRQRFYPVGDKAVTNGSLEIDFVDVDNAAAPFAGGYQVDIILEVLLHKD